MTILPADRQILAFISSFLVIDQTRLVSCDFFYISSTFSNTAAAKSFH